MSQDRSGNYGRGVSKKGAPIGAAVTWTLIVIAFLLFVHHWNSTFSNQNLIVIYFGRPSDILQYFKTNAADLAVSSFWCAFVAVLALLISGLLAIVLLVLGLWAGGELDLIERTSAALQTIPVIVIVAISLLIETQISMMFATSFPVSLYCLPPVIIALMFPPLANGAGALRRMPIELKELLRIWDGSALWRIKRVYLPIALPEVLTGLRASSTWAISATLIAEGLLNGVSGDSDTLGHFLIRPFSSGASPGKTPAVALAAILLGFLVYMLFAYCQRLGELWLRGGSDANETAYSL